MVRVEGRPERVDSFWRGRERERKRERKRERG